MYRFSVLAIGLLAARVASAAIVGPSGYIVGSIPLPGASQGDVAVVGTSIVVGQGTFGAGNESVIRRDFDGTVTTLANGFNSLSGFAIGPQGDLLFVADNGFEQMGAVTGDTLFAIDAPRTATMAVAAVGHEVAAPGTIPFAQGVAVSSSGQLLVSNAVGGSSGTVLRHRSFLYPPFVTQASGFSLTAGMVFAPNGHLFVGDLDSTTFVGRVVELDGNGAAVGTLAGGLSGASDLTMDRDGNVLVSGGFTGDFSSSTIVSIDAHGTVNEFAHGFSFSSGLDVDPISGRVYALDFGVSAITTFTPIDALLSGGGAKATDCLAEFSDVAPVLNRHGQATMKSICRDGDSCDRDGVADGVCTFGVGVCINVAAGPQCVVAGVDSFTVTQPQTGPDPQLATLQSTVAAILPSTSSSCVGPVPITVALRSTPNGLKPANKMVRTRAVHTPITGRPQNDVDVLTLRCVP
ncbi:MAG TPA: hypothetical protein VMT89_05470 [Candidatus Acidoferrales bacterium]|nr:hypothetical protein [Candidatus Acidoferrales bacterium]